MSPTRAHVTAVLVDERYRELASWRTWYRMTGSRLFQQQDDLVAENRIRIRELVAIRWAARRAARMAERRMEVA